MLNSRAFVTSIFISLIKQHLKLIVNKHCNVESTFYFKTIFPDRVCWENTRENTMTARRTGGTKNFDQRNRCVDSGSSKSISKSAYSDDAIWPDPLLNPSLTTRGCFRHRLITDPPFPIWFCVCSPSLIYCPLSPSSSDQRTQNGMFPGDLASQWPRCVSALPSCLPDFLILVYLKFSKFDTRYLKDLLHAVGLSHWLDQEEQRGLNVRLPNVPRWPPN